MPKCETETARGAQRPRRNRPRHSVFGRQAWIKEAVR